MNQPDTGTIVYYTPDADAPRPCVTAEVRRARSHPIDLSDMPEVPGDAIWLVTGPDKLLGPAIMQALTVDDYFAAAA